MRAFRAMMFFCLLAGLVWIDQAAAAMPSLRPALMETAVRLGGRLHMADRRLVPARSLRPMERSLPQAEPRVMHPRPSDEPALSVRPQRPFRYSLPPPTR